MDVRVESRFHLERAFHRLHYVSIFGLSLGGVIMGIGILLALAREGRPILHFTVPIPFLLAGLWGLVWLKAYLARSPEWVEVGPDGLRWRKQGKETTASWDDVHELYRHHQYVFHVGEQPTEWHRRAHLRLVFRDRTEVEFHEVLSNFDELVWAVEQYVTAALLPEAAAAFERTGLARFGPLTITREGVAVNGDPFSWGGIQYAVSRGHLRITPNTTEFDDEAVRQIKLPEIPNYLVAVALMQRFGKPAVDAPDVWPPAMREFVMRHDQALAGAEAAPAGEPTRRTSGVRIRDEEPLPRDQGPKEFTLPRPVKIVVGCFFVLFALPVLAFAVFLWDDCRFVGFEPHPLTAAELVATGPGSNHAVRISDFVAGDPVLVPFPVGEPQVWFPVYLTREQQAAGKPPILYCVGTAKDQSALEPPRELTGIVDHAGGFLPAPNLDPRVREKLPLLAGGTPWVIHRDRLNPWPMAVILTCVGLVFLGGGLMLIRGRSARVPSLR